MVECYWARINPQPCYALRVEGERHYLIDIKRACCTKRGDLTEENIHRNEPYHTVE